MESLIIFFLFLDLEISLRRRKKKLRMSAESASQIPKGQASIIFDGFIQQGIQFLGGKIISRVRILGGSLDVFS